MLKQSIASLAIGYREEHTAAALLRSTNIENCAPEGIFRLIHACAIATKDGEAKTIPEIRKVYSTSDKASKEVMNNLGKITAYPFPIIDSSKKSGIGSEKYIETPLYDISTGNTVAERYASVKVNHLGRLLTRHYLDKGLDEVKYYKSIVPYSLLRRTMPFTLGYRSEMYPLNPREMFIIMKEMMKANSPIINPTILEENFKGFDLGDGYVVFMTQEALMELYTTGVSSFVATPKVTIKRDTNELIFEMPPLDSNSKALRDSLIQLHGNTLDGFKTFSYDIDVKLVGKRVILRIESWNGTDADIQKELLYNSMITVRKAIENVTVRYKADKDGRKVIDTSLGKPIIPKILTDYEPFKSMDEDTLRSLTTSKIKYIIDKEKLLPDIMDDSTDYKDIIMGLTNNNSEEDIMTGGDYPFVIDKAPVIEVLWECILGERELQVELLKKKLAALEDKLKYDILAEKATRKEVATIIYRLQKLPQETRITELLKECHKGSEVLPEGFERWEAEEIYKYTGNNLLAKIFERKRFENEFLMTQERIEALVKKIGDTSAIDADIIRDMDTIINNPKYARKTSVLFLKDEALTKFSQVSPTHFWDEKPLPVSLYFDEKVMTRSYGVNLSITAFNPKAEYRTRNDKKIAILYTQADESVDMLIKEVRDIPRNGYMPMPPGFRGIIPIGEDVPITIFTNKGRYFRYNKFPTIALDFAPDEVVVNTIGNPYNYIDILCSGGYQVIDASRLTYLKTKFNKLGNHIKDLYDVRARDELNKDIPIPVQGASHVVTKYKTLRTFESAPLAIGGSERPKIFSEHLALFVDGLYAEKWSWIFVNVRDDKYRPNRPVYVNEYAAISPYKDMISEDLLNKYNKIKEDLVLGKNNYKLQILTSYFAPSYYDVCFEDKELHNIIDQRRWIEKLEVSDE